MSNKLGATYYWLKALWWLLLLVNFPFDLIARIAVAVDDFTFSPAYRVANVLYERRKAAGKRSL